MHTIPRTPINAAAFGAALLLVLTSGCVKPRLIPHTKVLDTPLNREILEVVEKYRQAMERLEPAKILALAHPTYQDDCGTAEGNDDIDFDGLRELLTIRFKKTRKIRYRIEYQALNIKGQQAQVDAYIDATFVYDEPGANPRWRRLTDHNRFSLLKDGERWRFVSGL